MANITKINGKNIKDSTAARMASLAPIEASTTATVAHAVGEYFWLGDTLYEATAAIAVGGTITVGTNCKTAVLGDSVADLKSQINADSVPKVKTDYVAKIYPVAASNLAVTITGTATGKAVHCGKNLFDESLFLLNPNIRKDTNGYYYGYGSYFNNVLAQLLLPSFKPHKNYILSYTCYSDTANMYWKAGFSYNDGSTRYASNSSTTPQRIVHNSSPSEYIERGYNKNVTGLKFTYSNSGIIYIKDVMLVEANYDDGVFEAFNGQIVDYADNAAQFTAFDGENNVYANNGTVIVEYLALRKSHRASASVVCLGDSITGNYPTATVLNSYPGLIENVTGMDVVNGGFGGCRMSLHTVSYRAPFSFCSLVDAIVSGVWTDQDSAATNLENNIAHVFDHIQNLKTVDWSSVEYVIVFYGTNDWSAQVPIDNPENPKDTSTYLGAFRYGYEKLVEEYPNIKVIPITPMYRYDASWDSDTQRYNGKYLYDFGDALIEVCKGYKIPYVDMYRVSGVNSINRANYIADGTHPTENGIINLANIIGGAVMAN